MSFQSLNEFLAMGGHGLYVWLAYGSTALVVLANVLAVRRARRKYFREAQALERRLDRGTGGGPDDPNSPRMEGTQ